MTDMLRRIRTRMRAAGAGRQRPLKLLVRVPPTLADCSRVGLDVSGWIAEGLVGTGRAAGRLPTLRRFLPTWPKFV
jgi:hypothetical protein